MSLQLEPECLGMDKKLVAPVFRDPLDRRIEILHEPCLLSETSNNLVELGIFRSHDPADKAGNASLANLVVWDPHRV